MSGLVVRRMRAAAKGSNSKAAEVDSRPLLPMSEAHLHTAAQSRLG